MATSNLIAIRALGTVGTKSVFSTSDPNSPFFYETGMEIDADGAYKSYHPDSKSGLDNLKNAGGPGNWYGVVTDKSGNPIVQGPTDPAPGFYVSATSLQDTTHPTTSPLRYVDASTVPYIVLPGKKTFGAVLGDFCYVYNIGTKKASGGVFGDTGPANKLGEASIAMAAALGIPSSPRTGGTGAGVVYLVFPGSRKGWPLSVAEIQKNATDLFNVWGGMAKLTVLIPEIEHA